LSLLRCRYHHYLAEVRGLSQQSLKQHGTTVADFLSRGLSSDRSLSGLTAADVEAFVQIKSRKKSHPSLQHIVAHLRAFLRYCGDHGEAPGGLDVIDTPRVYRGELPPRALDWTTVRRCSPSAGCSGLGGRNAEGRPAEDTIDSCPAIGRPDLVPAAPLPAGWQSRQRPAATLLAHPQPDPRDKPLRGHRDLQLPGCPERSPARRRVVLFTAPFLRHAIAASRRRHQGNRRPAWTSKPRSNLCVPAG